MFQSREPNRMGVHAGSFMSISAGKQKYVKLAKQNWNQQLQHVFRRFMLGWPLSIQSKLINPSNIKAHTTGSWGQFWSSKLQFSSHAELSQYSVSQDYYKTLCGLNMGTSEMTTERMNRNNNSISTSSLSSHGGYFFLMTVSVYGSVLVKVSPYLPGCSQAWLLSGWKCHW